MSRSRPDTLTTIGAFASIAVVLSACRSSSPDISRADEHRKDGSTATASAGAIKSAPPVTTPSKTEQAKPARAGMAWIPPGTLRAGTPPDRTPRIAEEELPGTPVELGGYFIDLLPYPNEAGAIPTSNVNRAEAAQLCEAKGKRLCTELEWERACKGPDNTTYEYGNTYRENACGTGVPAWHSARRPSGERATCKSAFGVLDMHGAMWEWTDTAWKRGADGRAFGTPLTVLRGGNSEAGELVGRCANAIARKPNSASPTMGFRCCAGEKNDPAVPFVAKKGVALERSSKPNELAAGLVPHGEKTWGSDGAGRYVATYAWTWHPAPNEELRITSGCAHPPDAISATNKTGARCGVIVARLVEGSPDASPDAGALVTANGGTRDVQILATIDSGPVLSEVVVFGDSKRLRMWGIDGRGSFVREFGYAFGRVVVADPKRQ